jgi:hypothetical protein
MTGNESPEDGHEGHHGDKPKGVVRKREDAHRSSDTYKGCNALSPYRFAKAPVMNGKTADPACPKAATQPVERLVRSLTRIDDDFVSPIEPVRIFCGSTRPAWFMHRGYIGPRRTPTNETATAFPMSDGTNQTTSSSLYSIGFSFMNDGW